MEIIAAIIGAIIGGFLAAGAAWFADRHREKTQRKNLHDLFSTAIIDDLQNSIFLYEKIQEDWSKSNLVWFVTLNELRKSRQTYDKHSEHILLFKSHTLRQRISKYYLKSENLISTLEVQQKRKYDLDNKYTQTIFDLKSKHEILPESEIINKAQELMKNETIELKWLNDNMPKLISKLDAMIVEAQSLIDKISESTQQ